MPRYKIVNNIKSQCTAEEENELDIINAEWTKNKNARIAAETATANNKTSGKAKLKSGDALTDAEISALFGDN